MTTCCASPAGRGRRHEVRRHRLRAGPGARRPRRRRRRPGHDPARPAGGAVLRGHGRDAGVGVRRPRLVLPAARRAAHRARPRGRPRAPSRQARQAGRRVAAPRPRRHLRAEGRGRGRRPGRAARRSETGRNRSAVASVCCTRAARPAHPGGEMKKLLGPLLVMVRRVVRRTGVRAATPRGRPCRRPPGSPTCRGTRWGRAGRWPPWRRGRAPATATSGPACGPSSCSRRRARATSCSGRGSS